MKIKVAASILASDFSRLGQEVWRAEKAGADYIHVDVMDGLFVPNITIGMPVLASLKKYAVRPLDVHLMIQEPIRYVRRFRAAGASHMIVHAEACSSVGATLRAIKATGAKAGLSLRPKAPLSAIKKWLPLADQVMVMTVEPGFGGQKFIKAVLPKIKQLRAIYPGDIEVDGGINYETAQCTAEAGANVFVVGHFLFTQKNMRRTIDGLRKCGQQAWGR